MKCGAVYTRKHCHCNIRAIFSKTLNTLSSHVINNDKWASIAYCAVCTCETSVYSTTFSNMWSLCTDTTFNSAWVEIRAILVTCAKC